MDLIDRYYTVLDALPDHVFIFSASGIYIDVYGGEDNKTGFDCKSFIGRSLYDALDADMAQQLHGYIQQALASNKTQTVQYKFNSTADLDLPEHTPQLHNLWFEGIIKPLSLIHEGERTVIWTARNVTQRHELEQRLKALSELDELTGIANRRSFSRLLTNALTEYHLCQRSFAVLMFDIDRFKRINDSVGHSCGDAVIQHVVNLSQSTLRASDCIARIGGEEFAIILKDAHLAEAALVAEKIREKIAQNKYCSEHYLIEVTVSFGISQAQADDDEKSIFARADKAMYYSKQHGRNQVNSYAPSMESNHLLATQKIELTLD